MEDTNALALAFNDIATKNGRALATPTKYFITGHSMGGHITAAAIEDEAAVNAVHKVKYSGAVPMCGVVGDTELFNEFAAMRHRAGLAGVPAYVDKSDISAGDSACSRRSHDAGIPDAVDRGEAGAGDNTCVLQNHRRSPADVRAGPAMGSRSFSLRHLHRRSNDTVRSISAS